MATEQQISQDIFQLGQEVFDEEGNKIGKVRARFARYILVERGGLFGQAYYIPRSVFKKSSDGVFIVTSTDTEIRKSGWQSVPDDLYDDVPEQGIPQVFSGVPKFGKRPLSPAQTGHYHYGRHWPGINTDAAGSYHRDEVLPIPQKLVKPIEKNRRKV